MEVKPNANNSPTDSFCHPPSTVFNPSETVSEQEFGNAREKWQDLKNYVENIPNFIGLDMPESFPITAANMISLKEILSSPLAEFSHFRTHIGIEVTAAETGEQSETSVVTDRSMNLYASGTIQEATNWMTLWCTSQGDNFRNGIFTFTDRNNEQVSVYIAKSFEIPTLDVMDLVDELNERGVIAKSFRAYVGIVESAVYAPNLIMKLYFVGVDENGNSILSYPPQTGSSARASAIYDFVTPCPPTCKS